MTHKRWIEAVGRTEDVADQVEAYRQALGDLDDLVDYGLRHDQADARRLVGRRLARLGALLEELADLEEAEDEQARRERSLELPVLYVLPCDGSGMLEGLLALVDLPLIAHALDAGRLDIAREALERFLRWSSRARDLLAVELGAARGSA